MYNNRLPPVNSIDEAFALVKPWLADCTRQERRQCKKHASCLVSLGAELPARVVQVLSTSATSKPLEAKLVEPPKGTIARYVALSYCWGEEGHNPVTTTQANYAQHLVSLPVGHLALSLQDAIETTVRLGLEYLWVDSLCIIQDSQEDKESQISRMGTVYENAFVTVVAAHGENANCGFLRLATRKNDAVFKLRCSHEAWPAQVWGTIYCSKWVSRHMATPREPIDRRGWTLQERLLSKRKLLFFADTVAWECASIPVSDTGGLGYTYADMNQQSKFLEPTAGKFSASRSSVQWWMEIGWMDFWWMD